jgi:hypothetical protein
LVRTDSGERIDLPADAQLFYRGKIKIRIPAAQLDLALEAVRAGDNPQRKDTS